MEHPALFTQDIVFGLLTMYLFVGSFFGTIRQLKDLRANAGSFMFGLISCALVIYGVSIYIYGDTRDLWFSTPMVPFFFAFIINLHLDGKNS